MRIVTSAEMKALEAEADASGLTYVEMIRRAGEAVARAVDTELDGSGVVVLLAGPGNNGADTLFAAAELHDAGILVHVYLWEREMDGDELVGELVRRDVEIARSRDDARREILLDWLDTADAVVDGLVGTGLSRPIKGELAEILAAVEEAAEPADGPVVVAVDVATGLNPDDGSVDPCTVRADLTVTFGLPKVGHYLFPGAEYVGELIHDSIGITDDDPKGRLFVPTTTEIVAMLPARPMAAHKGRCGCVVVVAVSVPYPGAAYLAAAAAYRSGAGLVTVAIPGSIHGAVAARLPEATFLVLPENLGVVTKGAAALLQERWSDYEALLVGPGLTTERPAAEFLEALLGPAEESPGRPAGTTSPPPAFGFRVTGPAPITDTVPTTRPAAMVFDADALNLAAASGRGLDAFPAGSVVTPHPGEMGRLLGTSAEDVNRDRLGTAREAAAKHNLVVVLKGAFTVVAAPDGRTAIIPFANPALATAGTGDVLAGIIAGFLAQGLVAFDASIAGAFVHGMAGEIGCREIGNRALVAHELLEMIGVAFSDLGV